MVQWCRDHTFGPGIMFRSALSLAPIILIEKRSINMNTRTKNARESIILITTHSQPDFYANFASIYISRLVDRILFLLRLKS